MHPRHRVWFRVRQISLSDFILGNIDDLLAEWERFARTAQPDHVDLDREALRDWAENLLRAIAQEIRGPQPDAEIDRKAKRLRATDTLIREAAHVHAIERLAQGFKLDEMIAEYRALRTSVVLRWKDEIETNGEALEQLIRFDEALDEALSESARRYTLALERARDLFIGALGHDMSNPLASIVSVTELFLLASEEFKSHQLQGIVRIRNSASRITRMVKDLTDFTLTRLGGMLPISRETVDVSTICGNIVDELSVSYPDRDFHMSCGTGLVGYFDPGRVEQLLSNLVSNAIRHGSDGGPITVKATGDKETVRLSVHNEGNPIPKRLQTAIFEPLVRGGLESSSEGGDWKPSNGGLGLGLYIAKQIAEAHGGKIAINSKSEHGTTFEVMLPRAAATRGASPDGRCGARSSPGRKANRVRSPEP